MDCAPVQTGAQSGQCHYCDCFDDIIVVKLFKILYILSRKKMLLEICLFVIRKIGVFMTLFEFYIICCPALNLDIEILQWKAAI